MDGSNAARDPVKLALMVGMLIAAVLVIAVGVGVVSQSPGNRSSNAGGPPTVETSVPREPSGGAGEPSGGTPPAPDEDSLAPSGPATTRPDQVEGVVLADAPVRVGPGPHLTVVGDVGSGQRVTVLCGVRGVEVTVPGGTTDVWLHVVVRSSGSSGYLPAPLVQVDLADVQLCR